MTREQLAHILRSAAKVAKDGDILVIGSQSILGSYRDEQLPEWATRSIEADIAFRLDPDAKKADLVDGAIGEGSLFNQTYGYYGQGVEVSTATLPAGWEKRVVPFVREDAKPSHANCLERHDLVVSKLVANRQKDIEFTTALIKENLVGVPTLLERTRQLEQPGAIQSQVTRAIRLCERKAK